jgi:hypothetical protein
MLTAAFAAAGAGLPGVAFAVTSGAGGSGCGNAAAVLGDSAAGCEALATVQHAGGSPMRPAGGITGQPHTVPMRRLGAAPATTGPLTTGPLTTVPPMAGSLLPGLATLPVLSALEGQHAQAASKTGKAKSASKTGKAKSASKAKSARRGRASSGRRPALPAGVHLPWASTGSATGRLPLGTTREGVTRLPRTHGKAPVRQAAPSGPSVLGALPAVAGTPDLTDHAVPPAGSATTADSTAVRNVMPASTLAADSAPGMGSASFYCLAIGALMAGAVALKMAGRRIRGRKA